MKTLIEWAGTTVVTLAILLAVFMALSSSLLGWQFNAVLSGSMSPTLKVGGLVLAQPVDPKAIEVGDIIAYYSPAHGKTIVHRVIEKDEVSQLQFRTQGDANSAPDPYPVLAQDVVGKVSFHVPLLGYVSQFVKTPLGSILLLVLPGVMIIGMEMKNIRTELSNLRKGKAATDGAETSATRRRWTTGLRTEDWMSWGPAADSHI